MICVIADDFTGAAEIGGVALRYGLSVEVQSAFCPEADVELICIDADTRSCSSQEAARRAQTIARQCRAASIDRVFKKVDSVLRGQVAAELLAMMPVLGNRRALLVPANPSLGRVILGGQYLVDGRPLHLTGFARDPEYPTSTSDVSDILGVAIHMVRVGDKLPQEGIVVGEAATGTQVKHWAQAVDRSILPAGAAEFFARFLEADGHGPSRDTPVAGFAQPEGTVLFVCGSTSDYSRGFVRRCESAGVPVERMPVALLEVDAPEAALIDDWTEATLRALRAVRVRPLSPEASRTRSPVAVMVAIDRPLRHESGLPQRLSYYLATVVGRVLERHVADRIYVEGGATAIALIRRLGWQRLRVRQELAPGVVSLQVSEGSGPLVTMKPGSYAWPAQVDVSMT